MYKTHGQTHSPTYRSWQHMKQRCLNPNNDRFYAYGGRGITICQRWQCSFTAFLEDMGVRPPDTSLDRINNDGPYSPENCRWATRSEQDNNTQKNRVIGGIRRSLPEHANANGLSYNTLNSRIKRGCDPEKAITLPVIKRVRHYQIETSETLVSLAKEHHLNPGALSARLQRGWDPNDALSTPMLLGKKRGQKFLADVPETLVSLAAEHGLSDSTLRYRLNSGWPLDRALNTPVQRHYG